MGSARRARAPHRPASPRGRPCAPCVLRKPAAVAAPLADRRLAFAGPARRDRAPSRTGPRKPHLPATMGDSCDEGDGMIFDDEDCKDPAAEPVAEPVTTRGVKTVALRKVWSRQFVAVHSLDLEMAPNQITGLLGANGAGKTPTISMLTVT